ncbi:MAG: hypothetical protein EP329_27205 [Deltaproteobacteria bacterium]|nr:MAG: hypothetical protein EP329_27205 [Deltaproteobacteria bacterium]
MLRRHGLGERQPVPAAGAHVAVVVVDRRVARLAEAQRIIDAAWLDAVALGVTSGPAFAEGRLVQADLAWRAGEMRRARAYLEAVRAAAGEPLANPWVCPRFAALATLLDAPAEPCPDRPVPPFGETAQLRAAWRASSE